MRDRPSLDVAWPEFGLAERRTGQTIVANRRAQPDQIAVPLDEHALGVAATPTMIILDFAAARRQEPGYFSWFVSVGDIRDAYASDEVRRRNDIWIRGARRDEAL